MTTQLPQYEVVVVGARCAGAATARLLAGRPWAELVPLLKLLAGFDIVFLVACTLAFPYTLEE